MKVQSAYTVPKIDVQLGGAFRSSPGPVVGANQVVLNAAVRPSLGRDLSGGAANVTVNSWLRARCTAIASISSTCASGRSCRVGRVRHVVSLDVYNALNANPVLTENAAYRDTTISGWRVPTSILPARFAKFGVQLDF